MQTEESNEKEEGMSNEVIVQLEDCEYSRWKIKLIFPLKHRHGRPLSSDVYYWENSEEMGEAEAIVVTKRVVALFVNAKAQYRVPKHETRDL